MQATLEMRVPPSRQNTTGEPNIELQNKIRTRAYELYEQRGCGEGHDVDDWLQAESEVTARSAAA
jgi:DUF2934 family protein